MMSLQDWESKIQNGLLEIVWSHWNKLGANVYGKPINTNSDPEAAIVLGVLLSDLDQRFLEIMAQWLEHYESAVNVERLKTALTTLEGFKDKKRYLKILHDVLIQSLPASSIKRWNKILAWHLDDKMKTKTPSIENKSRGRKKLQEHSRILKQNLFLAFRFLIGATAKADVLYHLKHHWIPVEEKPNSAKIAKKLHYNQSTIHRVLAEVKLSLVLHEDGETKRTQHLLNREMPLLCLPPREDSFFVDWFEWIPVAIDVINFKVEVFDQKHEDVLKFRLKERVKRLTYVIDRSTHSIEFDFKDEVNVTDLSECYLMGLKMALAAFTKPSSLNWGDDSLTDFLEICKQNSWATYVHHAPQFFQELVKIDALYVKFNEYLHANYKTSKLALDSHMTSRFLLHRTISAYRSAVIVCTGGQAPESLALSRLLLENALYAFYLFRYPDFEEIFQNRDRSDKDKRIFREKFALKKMIKELHAENSNYGHQANILYESAIDFGAHPNKKAVFGNLRFLAKDDEATEYATVYASLEGDAIQFARLHIRNTGLLGLLVFSMIDPQSFKKSGLEAELEIPQKILFS